MIKGAIFDVDGTLLDTMPIWTNSGANYLASLGIEAEEGLGNKLFAMTVDMGAVYLKETYGLTQSCGKSPRASTVSWKVIILRTPGSSPGRENFGAYEGGGNSHGHCHIY